LKPRVKYREQQSVRNESGRKSVSAVQVEKEEERRRLEVRSILLFLLQASGTINENSVDPNASLVSKKGPTVMSGVRLPPKDKLPGDKIGPSLLVTLSNCEFVKEFHYFVTIQLGKNGEKKRTEVSSYVNNPVFKTNIFTIPLQGFKIEYYQELFFSVFIILDVHDYSREEKEGPEGGQAKLLGECVLNLVPYKNQLTDISGQGVKQSLKFTRKHGMGEITIGRFVANMKIVGEEVIPHEESIANSNILPDKTDSVYKLNQTDIVRPLPKSDGLLFKWRVRVDIRSAVDIAFNQGNPTGMPSCFVELGISTKLNTRPDDRILEVTKTIPDTKNPIWNQQFLLVEPLEGDGNKKKFVYMGLWDKHKKDKPIAVFYFPIEKMAPFHPYNFEAIVNDFEFKLKPKFYFSLILEETDPKSKLEQYSDVVVHNVEHDPAPAKLNRFMIVMTLYNFTPKEIQFNQLDMATNPNYGSILTQIAKEDAKKPIFISSILKIPPMQVSLQIYADRVVL
jgi:hypothetical protein